jgi:hypothetical protein
VVQIHDGVWARLFESGAVSEGTAKAWAQGLSLNRAATAEVLIRLLDTGNVTFLFRRDLPPGVLDAAVDHPAKRVWGTAVDSGNLSAAQWERILAATEGRAIHELLLELSAAKPTVPWSPIPGRGVDRPPSPDARPPSTRAEITARAEAVPDIDADHFTYALWWVAALYDDPAAMRQLAASPKLWVRRSVARAPRLPQDVVRLLARDEDDVVRLFLTESCDDAPAELLLEVWTWWPGSLSFPGRPRNHPNFPRHGLLRFADDPHPRLRMLALDDPASTADLVERLTHDPDPAVRARAAEDDRLSPASATRLLNDPDPSVRHFALRHPALPPAVLVSQLLHEESAAEAAENPAVPPTVMRRMIGLDVLPDGGLRARPGPF